ncbi:MAG: ankyrin repeat domain-containing protein, partial [Puniceicoccales bacterium]|nr:ankyrin repeat domain-containing protein [Puniceicoccales bacterium]
MNRKLIKNVMLGCFCLGNGLLGMEVSDESDKKAGAIPQEEQAKETLGNKLLRAAVFGDKALIERLLAEGGDLNQVTLFIDPESGEIIRKGEPPLNYAVSSGILEAVRIFLNNGADVNRGNAFGVTPLHVAMYSDNLNRFEIAELLLKKGANPNAKNNDGHTPLMILVDRISELTERYYRFVMQQDPTFDPSSEIDRCSKIPELLINHDANTDIQDNQGNTALLRAISFRYPSFELVRNIIKLGADVNIPNNNGET